ncbi:hypothetical protein GW17_00047610 [Ensete ventricosum]|nr:hypothetical protein GW17_00047610 [Ensete ventricosum]
MDVLLTHFSSDEEPSLDIEGVDEDGDFGGIPTSINAVKELVVVKYERGGDIREESCIICFEEFNEDVEVTRMPSKHVFHGDCLTRWLESSHPLSTPVVINLSYTVMYSLEGRLVEEPLRSLSGTSSTKNLTAK